MSVTARNAQALAKEILTDPLLYYGFLKRILSAEAARKQGRHEKTYDGVLRPGTSIHMGSFHKALEIR